MAQAKRFSVVKVSIVIVVFALIALVAWRVWDASQHSDDSTGSSQESLTAPTIQSESDLDKASSTLDAMDVESDETAKLDAQTDF